MQNSIKRRVCILALPDAVISTISGIYDVMNAPSLMDLGEPAFEVSIVGVRVGPLALKTRHSSTGCSGA